MIGQAIDMFTECKRQQNEQFRLSMQNVINTQFTNLGVALIQNLQQAQMSMLGCVVAPIVQPPAITKPPPTI